MPTNDLEGQVGPSGGAQSGPLDFRPPGSAAPVPASGGSAQYNPYDPRSVAGKKWAAEHPDTGEVFYDEDGYPLPTAAQASAARENYNSRNSEGRAKPGDVAYDPSIPPPKPQSDNPHQRGTPEYERWRYQQGIAETNQRNKEAWQKQRETQRKAPEVAAPKSSAPATPFQSAGMDLTKQGKGESYIDSILGSYEKTGIPQVGNESARTLSSFRGTQPANMDPYYDHASKLASAKIDNAMAARGSYGSSNATGQIGAAEVALRAQQARDNASYGLSRFAQEGALAGAADQQGNVGNGIQFQWTKGLADMARQSQELGQGRNQQLWDNNFSLAAAKAGIYGAGAGAAIDGVTGATDAAINAKQGVASDALSNANANANASNSATAGLLNAANQGVSNYTKFNNGKSN